MDYFFSFIASKIYNSIVFWSPLFLIKIHFNPPLLLLFLIMTMMLMIRYLICLLFSSCFNFFLFWFSAIWLWCPCDIFFIFILHSVFWVSWIWELIFSLTMETFSCYFFKYFFCIIFTPLSFQDSHCIYGRSFDWDKFVLSVRFISSELFISDTIFFNSDISVEVYYIVYVSFLQLSIYLFISRWDVLIYLLLLYTLFSAKSNIWTNYRSDYIGCFLLLIMSQFFLLYVYLNIHLPKFIFTLKNV